MKSIPVFKPLIQKEELEAVQKSLEVGWLGMGKSVGEFEQALAEFLDLKDRFVVVLSTGHAALHLAILLCDFERDSEIITPSFNNVADFQAILAAGCKPVFCDIEESSLCIDPDKIEALITPKTKAIIMMDYFCNIADHDAIQKIAAKHRLRLIHDAAHSFGSSYKGKKVGSYSDICMFSFDPVKTITSIDGGALVVTSEKDLSRLREMRLIGMSQSTEVMYDNKRAWSYDVQNIGYRYHLSNPHAAIGLAQLKKMPLIMKTRRKSCDLYNDLLSDIAEVTTPNTDFHSVTPFLFFIRVPQSDRDNLRNYLKDYEIDTGVHWQPGHHFSLFSHERSGSLEVTERIVSEIISLPLHSDMDQDDVQFICSKIKAFFSQGSSQS